MKMKTNCRHEWRQKLIRRDYHIGHGGYFCIYCLEERHDED